MNLAVQLLQRFHGFLFMCFYIADTACGCFRGSDGRHIWYFCLDGCLTQIAVVINAVFADWRVDDQVDLSVCDQVVDIRASLIEFLYFLCGNTGLCDLLVSISGSKNTETAFMQRSGNFYSFRAVLTVYGNQYRTFQRQLRLCCFLRFVERFAVGVGKSQYFAGISGPRIGSTSGNILNGNTASLTP